MPAPTFNLASTGTDPKTATEENLKASIDAGFLSLYNKTTSEEVARASADTTEALTRAANDAAETSARTIADAEEKAARIAGDAANYLGDYWAGIWDASTGLFPAVRNAGGAVQSGDYFIVSTAGTFGGVTYAINETIKAYVDGPSTTDAADWYHLDVNAALGPVFANLDELNARTFSAASQANVDAAALVLSNGSKFTMNGLKYTLDSTATTAAFAPFDGAVPSGDATITHWPNVVANAVDTYAGGAWHKDYIWAGSTVYGSGDIVQINGTPNISRMCIASHTSPASWVDDPTKWVTGSFSGTDCTDGINSAIAYCGTRRIPLTFPTGRYYVAEVAAGEHAFDCPDYCHFIWEDGAELLVDEDISHTSTTLNAVFSHDNESQDGEIGTKEQFISRNMTLRGRWSHGFNTSVDVRGIVGLSLSGYEVVDIDGFECTDWRGNPTNIGAFDRATACGAHIERSASDGIRLVGGNSITISDGFFKDTSDDAIATHTRDRQDSQLTTTTYGHTITNNILIKAESIACKGGSRMIVAGNYLLWPQGSAISIGNNNDPEGSSSCAGVSVTGNIVENATTHYVPDTGWPTYNRGRAFLEVGGVAATANGAASRAGTYSGGVVADYWDDRPLWGNDWYNTGSDPTLSPSAPATGSAISGNVFLRTSPVLAQFSDAGIGLLFKKTGWYNPPVTDDAFRDSGINMQSEIDTLSITGNAFFGFRRGGAIYADILNQTIEANDAYKNILISCNTSTDCLTFFSSSRRTAGGGVKNLDITFDGNFINGDPFHKNARRVTPINGGWLSSAITDLATVGMELYGWTGYRLINNQYRNVYASCSPFNTTTLLGAGHIDGELMICDPSSTGHSVSNKGIGSIPPAGDAFRFMIEDSDPTSATWRLLKNSCPSQIGAIPSAGKWVQGQFVRKHNTGTSGGKVLLGWVRLTTGSGNVSGTDWSPAYATIT